MTDISGINTVSDGYNEHYTPTTEEIRTGYSTATYDDSKAEAEFDRWLAQHERKVKAEAWGEGHWEGWQNAREALLTDMFGGPTLNPYREETE